MSADLETGPNSLRLVFRDAEIVDHQSQVRDPSHLDFAFGIANSVGLQILLTRYPEPPEDYDFQDPDVKVMYVRYIGYRQGKEPLTGMAYFCLTQLKESAGGLPAAAKKWRISRRVLTDISKLSSGRGGLTARKAVGVNKPLTPEETRWLDQAIRKIILHAARMAHSPDTTPQLTRDSIAS